MVLNISLALAATGGYLMQSILNNKGRIGRHGSTTAAIGMLIAIVSIIAAFFVMTWWWVIVGIIVMSIFTGTIIAIFRENSIFVGITAIVAAIILLIIHLIIY